MERESAAFTVEEYGDLRRACLRSAGPGGTRRRHDTITGRILSRECRLTSALDPTLRGLGRCWGKSPGGAPWACCSISGRWMIVLDALLPPLALPGGALGLVSPVPLPKIHDLSIGIRSDRCGIGIVGLDAVYAAGRHAHHDSCLAAH